MPKPISLLIGVPHLAERLEKHSIADSSGCRIWTGALISGGKHQGKRPALRITTGKWQSSKWNAARVAYFVAYGPFDDKLKVCHHCDRELCIEPHHLFLGTQLDNIRDRHRKGRTVVPGEKGEQRYNAKLRNRDILKIRELKSGGWNYREIAEQFGVSYSTIRNIFNAGNWKHV